MTSILCVEFNADSESVFVFVLALTVYDLYSFKISTIKT